MFLEQEFFRTSALDVGCPTPAKCRRQSRGPVLQKNGEDKKNRSDRLKEDYEGHR